MHIHFNKLYEYFCHNSKTTYLFPDLASDLQKFKKRYQHLNEKESGEMSEAMNKAMKTEQRRLKRIAQRSSNKVKLDLMLF